MTTALLGVELVVTVVFVGLSVVAVQNRDRPGALSAGLLWLVFALLTCLLAASRAAILSRQTVVAALVIGWLVLVPLWAGFVFEYTGLGPAVTRRWLGLGTGYVIVTGATTEFAGALDGLVAQLLRVGSSLLQTGLVGVGLFGVFLLVQSAVTYDDLPNAQASVLSLSGTGVSLLLFSLGTVDPAEPTTLPPVVTGFLGVIAGGFAVGVFRYRLFSDTPGTGPLARRSVLEAMSESVVVVDREDRLVDANEAAEATLGIDPTRDAGRPIAAILGLSLDGIDTGTTTVPTPDGRRQFDVSESLLTNQHHETVGTSYLLQDVTDEQTQKQRLEVFNRVLRHNLRNNLDAVRGFAEVLSDGSLDDPTDVASRIQRTATDLAEIGETVERADRVMTQDTLTLQQVDLETLCDAVAAAIRERYDCQITVVTTATDPLVRTDRAVLRMPLFEVVENAVEHSDADVPTVTIEISRAGDSGQIAVRDDGPGIPDREQAVLLDGEETPLRHGKGVGLWFVSWAITRLGGDLSFEDVADAGSEVRLTVPDRAEGTDDDSK
ncbi:ATP-binding protein [Halorientalis brevis]|uniref:histidine kinase n=1 Tax=Halorientalis brevis TaxID=1126241 RepID=A0ABD6CG85_9EURY|nr:ATP-binding protein [Halorientalis brevis]